MKKFKQFIVNISLFIVFLALSVFCLSTTNYLLPTIHAQDNSFVSIVNPIRGEDFWDLPNQKIEEVVMGQMEILKKNNLPATWLIRYDALNNQNTINILKQSPQTQEKGLFLEITPTWTTDSKVEYQKSPVWHNAGSVFLTGYSQSDREKLVDTAFEKFKSIFGAYPKSVGAWWIDSYSLDYMQKKYDITGALIVADQYSTDNYQIWGQFWGTPYYPQKRNALAPAQTEQNKIPVVMTQWATRDPVNGYGSGVEESTLSVQANDYIDYHDLNISYFNKLIDIYTTQKFNQVNQIVVGLENSYSWDKYKEEYQRQIQSLLDKSKQGQFSVITMSVFSSWYLKSFPDLSPPQIISANDPLNTDKKVVWYMDSYYRVGWFANSEGSVIRDLRQYIDGSEEICFLKACQEINFATFATRVLDEVTYGNRWIIDEGQIKNYELTKQGEDYLISYSNESGKLRKIGLLPRDIKIDNTNYSIDGAILQAINNTLENNPPKNSTAGIFNIKDSMFLMLLKMVGFLVFIKLAIFIPGYVLVRNFLKRTNFLTELTLSAIIGLVSFTYLSYIAGFLRLGWLPVIFIVIFLVLFFYQKLYKNTLMSVPSKRDIPIFLIIIAGTIFQIVPVFKSGLLFNLGVGFWGPNGHDGLWHLALINQLTKGIPTENPIFSGNPLQNYHYFFDLLVSSTYFLTKIPIADLLFRFYPILFSLLLGLGSLILIQNIAQGKFSEVKTKVVTFFSLYFIYFSGSFGWIVEYLREKHFGGESAFWANQSVSFNLNPPFAVSLLIVIALFILLFIKDKSWKLLVIITFLAGCLLEFKAYAGILVIGSLGILALTKLFKRQLFYLTAFISSSILTLIIVLPNLLISKTTSSISEIFIFSPFWFIHSMIDAPDRVGWERLSLMRMVGFEKNQWWKILISEGTGLFLFIVGNLGLRIISFGLIFKIKEIFKSDGLLFIAILAFFSTVIPILFIQQGNPWNTIQFFYYGMYIFALFAGFSLFWIFAKLPKIISLVIIGAILVLTPINSYVTAKGYLGNRPHAYISTEELEGLNFLANKPEGVVLPYPFDKNLRKKLPEPFPLFAYETSAYISAFSNKPSFEADEIQNDILATDYKKRLVIAKDFFRLAASQDSQEDISLAKQILSSNNIKYIYIPKQYGVILNEESLNLTNIFDNKQVIIYEVR